MGWLQDSSQERIGGGHRALVSGESSGRDNAEGKEFRSRFAIHPVMRTGRIAEWEAIIDKASARAPRNAIRRYQARDAPVGSGVRCNG
jgi:ketosteroid isomerase-like protein